MTLEKKSDIQHMNFGNYTPYYTFIYTLKHIYIYIEYIYIGKLITKNRKSLMGNDNRISRSRSKIVLIILNWKLNLALKQHTLDFGTLN